MNIKRGNDVLRMIDESIGSLESEAERLSLLLHECRKEEYWKLRNFKSEGAWIRHTFHDKSLRVVRQLAKLGEAYENQPNVITEIGVAKADAIKHLHHRSNWIARAKKMSLIGLTEAIKQSVMRIKTPKQAQRRIALLRSRADRLREQLAGTEREIEALQNMWNGRRLEDYEDVVCEKTRKSWAAEASVAQ